MTKTDSQSNAVVILSDDEEEVMIKNEHGKRTRYADTKEEGYDNLEEAEYGSLEGEYDSLEDEEYENYTHSIKKNQTLPEDHESAILSERAIINPYQQINQVFNEFKHQFIDITNDDTDTGFACGLPISDNAPDIAMNIEGVIGPITFPLCTKDLHRVMNTKVRDKSCFSLDTSKIILNLPFQEYLFENILPEIMKNLGVDSNFAKNTRLEAKRFYIRAVEQSINMSPPVSNAYGSVIIILPSDFTGGEIITKYEKESIMFQPETSSLREIYYIAWYNNVETKILPLKSGHQVLIEFSLIYDGKDKSITSTLLQETRVMHENGDLTIEQMKQSKPLLDQITNFFKSDIINNSKYPYFYMLNYCYNISCLKLNELKKSDMILAKIFSLIAKESNFKMFIGSIEREVEGKMNQKESSNNLNGDCPMDEEGILLTIDVNYDEYTLTLLNDDQGNNLISKPMTMNSKEHQPILQGVSWYAKCKPDTEECNFIKKNVKYCYANQSALVFIPKQCSLLKNK